MEYGNAKNGALRDPLRTAQKSAAKKKIILDIIYEAMYNNLTKNVHRKRPFFLRSDGRFRTGKSGEHMKRIIAVIILLALALLLPGAAFASELESEHVNYITDQFNEENGLPTGEANTVVQDRVGYLWVGSYGGLIRYDGSSFVDYSDRLASSAIRSLFVAGDGALYIGTNDAGAYRFQNDAFTPLAAEDGNSFLCVRDFAEGEDGTVYVASTTGVGKLEGDRIIPYRYDATAGEHFLNIVADRDGNIWAMSDSGNVCVFNEGAYLSTVLSEDLFADGRIYAVACDRDGVYIGSSEGGLLKLAVRKDSVPGVVSSYDRTDFEAGDISAVNRIKPLADGTVLVSALNGFGFLDAQGAFHRVDKPADKNLSANWAETDHEGNLWVASSNYGVLRYSVGCFDSCNYNSALGEYTVNAVTRSGDRFYVATDSGVTVFDSDWNQLDSELGEIIQGFRVRNVVTDAAGRVWMATYSSHGAACYDPATGTITDFGEAEGLNSETVRVVYPLSDGRMLVGSQFGVNLIENGAITASYGAADGMENTSVLCALELNGRVFVGTDGSGVYEITGDGLRHYGPDEGLSQGVVLRMGADADGSGSFFVCAGDKLYYFSNGSFRALSGMEHGAGSIYSVYDVGGRIWLLQNGGIYAAEKAGVLAGEEVYTAQYGVKCGLTGTLSANTWSWLDEEDGSLYIPTRSGISKFHFRGPKVVTPRAILNNITVDDRVYEHPASMALQSDARRVTVDISELLFSETAEYILAYKLEGFDTEEILTTDKHVTVSYTNLKGGNYALKIRIIDPLTGDFSVQEDVPITKALRLTESPLFYALCAILAIVAVILLMRLYSRRQNTRLLKKQEEQTRYINDITKIFSECIDMRDTYTNGHSARVAKYTGMLARQMGYSAEEADRMYRIALLHDVGKISIPDAVLNKPGRLTDDEFVVMKSHSQRGYDVLKEMDFAPELALGAGCHHERYDGKGYPRGLKGDEIPEVAQIIGVADTFDAMYSTRPYRKKLPLATVVGEIKRCSGTQLSPKVVDAFLQLVDNGAFDDEEEKKTQETAERTPAGAAEGKPEEKTE